MANDRAENFHQLTPALLSLQSQFKNSGTASEDTPIQVLAGGFVVNTALNALPTGLNILSDVDDVEPQGHDIAQRAARCFNGELDVGQGLPCLLATIPPDESFLRIPGRLPPDEHGPCATGSDKLREPMIKARKERRSGSRVLSARLEDDGGRILAWALWTLTGGDDAPNRALRLASHLTIFLCVSVSLWPVRA